VTSLKDFSLLAANSQRCQQLEKEFEQVCFAAMAALRTSDDLVVLILGMVAELRSQGRSDTAEKALEYLMRNDLLPNRKQVDDAAAA